MSFSCHQLVIKINVIGAIKIIIGTCLCVLFLSNVDKVHSELFFAIKMRIIYDHILYELPNRSTISVLTKSVYEILTYLKELSINQDIVNTAIKWFFKLNYTTCQINLVGSITLANYLYHWTIWLWRFVWCRDVKNLGCVIQFLRMFDQIIMYWKMI